MMCDICGTEGARLRHVSRSYGRGENLLVIENVPVVSGSPLSSQGGCPHCGESYLAAETLHEIERIKRQRLGVTRPVAVAEFV